MSPEERRREKAELLLAIHEARADQERLLQLRREMKL